MWKAEIPIPSELWEKRIYPQRGLPLQVCKKPNHWWGTLKIMAQMFVHLKTAKIIPESTFQNDVEVKNVCVYSKFKTFQNNYHSCAGKECSIHHLRTHREKTAFYTDWWLLWPSRVWNQKSSNINLRKLQKQQTLMGDKGLRMRVIWGLLNGILQSWKILEANSCVLFDTSLRSC